MIALTEFRETPGITIDARSPSEFAQGHVPGSFNVPLLNDEQRVLVGTCYKEKGSDAAVELGYELVGPHFAALVRQTRELVGDQTAKILCWRGGLRSNTLAWLLQTAGVSCIVLDGGYKAFRRHCLETIEEPRLLHILGGLTGSGKTNILKEMAEDGEQVLDLEGLAHHRGSSYGGINMPPQPTTEQFENKIAMRWKTFDEDRPVWVEDESRRVGRCVIPQSLFEAMGTAPLYLVEKSLEERLSIIEQDYGQSTPEDLIAATLRIERRLGGLRTRQAVDHIREGNFRGWVRLVLDYYDKAYTHSLANREHIVPFATYRNAV